MIYSQSFGISVKLAPELLENELYKLLCNQLSWDMPRLIFSLIFILISVAGHTQAKFELANRKAIRLTENRIKFITDKEWRIERFETYVREDTVISTVGRGGNLKYNADGTFHYGIVKGKWLVIEGKYIKHFLEREDVIKMNFGGTFAVISLTDTDFVLTKLLTSSHDMKRVIHLTLRPRPKQIFSSTFKNKLYYSRLTTHQVDSISRLSSEILFEYNYTFTKDSVFYPTFDSLYRIKRKPKN